MQKTELLDGRRDIYPLKHWQQAPRVLKIAPLMTKWHQPSFVIRTTELYTKVQQALKYTSSPFLCTADKDKFLFGKL